MGTRVDLYLMGEEEGRQGVQACKLTMNSPAEQEIEERVLADDPAWRGCCRWCSFGRGGGTCHGASCRYLSGRGQYIPGH